MKLWLILYPRTSQIFYTTYDTSSIVKVKLRRTHMSTAHTTYLTLLRVKQTAVNIRYSWGSRQRGWWPDTHSALARTPPHVLVFSVFTWYTLRESWHCSTSFSLPTRYRTSSVSHHSFPALSVCSCWLRRYEMKRAWILALRDVALLVSKADYSLERVVD